MVKPRGKDPGLPTIVAFLEALGPTLLNAVFELPECVRSQFFSLKMLALDARALPELDSLECGFAPALMMCGQAWLPRDACPKSARASCQPARVKLEDPLAIARYLPWRLAPEEKKQRGKSVSYREGHVASHVDLRARVVIVDQTCVPRSVQVPYTADGRNPAPHKRPWKKLENIVLHCGYAPPLFFLEGANKGSGVTCNIS